MLTSDTKLRLVHAMTDQSVADEIEKRLLSSTPANAAASLAVLATLNQTDAMKKAIEERLFVGLAGSGSQGQELSQKMTSMLTVLQKHSDPGDVPAVAATATLDLTTDIVLTSVATGAARNTQTLTLQVVAAAANPTDTVLVDFTGTAAAIVCTVTPNDGTNNAATPVDLTTAELAELINTGSVVGKNITLTDASSLRALQTATGGDATVLVDAGEGDGEIATFASGANADDADTAPAQAAMGSNLMSDDTFEHLVHALGDRSAATEFKTKFNAMITAVQAITP